MDRRIELILKIDKKINDLNKELLQLQDERNILLETKDHLLRYFEGSKYGTNNK
jgi:hypothetical protein